MSDKLKESLSAVMDGEADEFEIRRVLDEASEDETLREVWQRYHLVRGVLQDRSYRTTDAAVESIWRRIDAGEGLDEADSSGPGAPRWLGRVAGFAVAATVAVAVVFSVDLARETTPAPVEVAKNYPSQVDMVRTRAYMLHHAQHTSMYNQAGTVPFVKVAAFRTQ